MDLQAEIDALKAKLDALQSGTPQKPAAWTGPLPAISDITFLTAALWDNGTTPKQTETGRKKYPHRYKLTLEAWTTSADQIDRRRPNYAFKRNINLYTPSPFLKQVVVPNVRSGKIAPDYEETLRVFAENQSSTDLLGVIMDRSPFIYHPFQFCLVTNMPVDPVLTIINLGDFIHVRDFVPGSNLAIRTAVEDRCGYFEQGTHE